MIGKMWDIIWETDIWPHKGFSYSVFPERICACFIGVRKWRDWCAGKYFIQSPLVPSDARLRHQCTYETQHQVLCSITGVSRGREQQSYRVLTTRTSFRLLCSASVIIIHFIVALMDPVKYSVIPVASILHKSQVWIPLMPEKFCFSCFSRCI